MTATAAARKVQPLNVHRRATFVKPGVKEVPLTTGIIDAIFPYFPLACRCISGYLDSSAQYWKVNYHYDLLMTKIDKLLAMETVEQKYKDCAKAIRSALMGNRPIPPSGYSKDKTIGETKDGSPPEKVVARHKLLKQSKRDFETVMVKAKVVDGAKKANPPTRDKSWWLSVAPVAPPGDSKHGTGYAIDIGGDNLATTRIATALGATLVYNEASHVHVEFASGVKLPS